MVTGCFFPAWPMARNNRQSIVKVLPDAQSKLLSNLIAETLLQIGHPGKVPDVPDV
jgi:hypothetical protein